MGCTNILAGCGVPSDDGEGDSTLFKLLFLLLMVCESRVVE